MENPSRGPARQDYTIKIPPLAEQRNSTVLKSAPLLVEKGEMRPSVALAKYVADFMNQLDDAFASADATMTLVTITISANHYQPRLKDAVPQPEEKGAS